MSEELSPYPATPHPPPAVHPIISTIRRFVETEVTPVATALEHADEYPHALVGRMRELGLFGALVPLEHGGLGLRMTEYARVIEELCRGWMSLAGVINSHLIMAHIIANHGTAEQRQLHAVARLRAGRSLRSKRDAGDLAGVVTVEIDAHLHLKLRPVIIFRGE